MNFTLFNKFPVINIHRLYSVIGNGRNALAATFRNHPPCLLNGEFCKQNLRRIFYQQPQIVLQQISVPIIRPNERYINILNYVTVTKFRKFGATQRRYYVKKVKKKKPKKKKPRGFLNKVKSIFGMKAEAKTPPSQKSKTTVKKKKLCGHFKRVEPKKKKRTPVKVIKAVPDPVECLKKQTSKLKKKELNPKEQREVEEKAAVTCPNPAKANDPMSLPYYFKKVCVEKKDGICKKFEMQRMPIKLKKQETDSCKQTKPQIIQTRMPSRVRADICKPHIMPYRKKNLEKECCEEKTELPCPKIKTEEPICNLDPTKNKSITEEPCKAETEPPCPKITTKEPICNLDPSKGKQNIEKPCKSESQPPCLKITTKEPNCNLDPTKGKEEVEESCEAESKPPCPKVTTEEPICNPYPTKGKHKIEEPCESESKPPCPKVTLEEPICNLDPTKGKQKIEGTCNIKAESPCSKSTTEKPSCSLEFSKNKEIPCKKKEEVCKDEKKEDICKQSKKKTEKTKICREPPDPYKIKLDCSFALLQGKDANACNSMKCKEGKENDTCKEQLPNDIALPATCDEVKVDVCKTEEGPGKKKNDCKEKLPDSAVIPEPCDTIKLDTCKTKEASCKKKDECKNQLPDFAVLPKPCDKVKGDACKRKGISGEKKDICKKKADICKQDKDPCKESKDSLEREKDQCDREDPYKMKKNACKEKDPCKQKLDGNKESCKKKNDSCRKRDSCEAKLDPCLEDVDPCKIKSDPCKKLEDTYKRNKELCKKENDPCKKKDPCEARSDSCLENRDPCKTENTCKKGSDSCLKKEDACLNKTDSCKNKKDSCGQMDPCKAMSDPCLKKTDPYTTKDTCKTKSDPCLKKEDADISKLDSCKKEKDSCGQKASCKAKSDLCLKKPDPCNEKDSCKTKSDSCLKKKEPCKFRSSASLKKEDFCKSTKDSSKIKDPCTLKPNISLDKNDAFKRKKSPYKTKPNRTFTNRELEDRARLKPRPCIKFSFKAPEEYKMKESTTVKKQTEEKCKKISTEAKPRKENEAKVCVTEKPKEKEHFEKDVKKEVNKESRCKCDEKEVKKAKETDTFVKATEEKTPATKKDISSCKISVLCKLKSKLLQLLGREKKVKIKVKALPPTEKPPKKSGKGGEGGSGSKKSGSSPKKKKKVAKEKGKKETKASGKKSEVYMCRTCTSKPQLGKKVTLKCKSKGKAIGAPKKLKAKCVQKKVSCDEKKCKIKRVCNDKLKTKKKQKVKGSKYRVNKIISNICGLQKINNDETKLTFVCKPKQQFCKQICTGNVAKINENEKCKIKTQKQKEKPCSSKNKPKILCKVKIVSKLTTPGKSSKDDKDCRKLGVKTQKQRQALLCTRKQKSVSESKKQKCAQKLNKKHASEFEGQCPPQLKNKIRKKEYDGSNVALAEVLEKAKTQLCGQKPLQNQVKVNKECTKAKCVGVNKSNKDKKSQCKVLESIWGTITSDKKLKIKDARKKKAKVTTKTPKLKCKSKAKSIKMKPKVPKKDVCKVTLQKEIKKRVNEKCKTISRTSKKYDNPCMMALEKEIELRMGKKQESKVKTTKSDKKACRMGGGEKKFATQKSKELTGKAKGGPPKKRKWEEKMQPKKHKENACAEPKQKKIEVQVSKKPEDSCKGVKRLGFKSTKLKTTDQHCKKVCLKVKKAKRQKKKSQFKVTVCKRNEEQNASSKSRKKCPKFSFIPFSEVEAKRNQKAKKGTIVSLKMKKKNTPNTENQSCQISTKVQGNDAQPRKFGQKCNSYALVSGVHRIFSYQSRLFSKNKDVCKGPPKNKPCDQKADKQTNCKEKKIMCYCLRNDGKGDKGPCGKKCDDEVPECRYCMRYKVQEEPQPKPKKEKLVRPKKLKKKQPPPTPPPPAVSKCKIKEKKKLCGHGECYKPPEDLDYGPPRIEPVKPKNKKLTGICNDTEGDI